MTTSIQQAIERIPKFPQSEMRENGSFDFHDFERSPKSPQSEIERRAMQKMEAIGAPLKEWDANMTGESLKYLCAILNSTMATWFMRSAALESGMGTTRWIPVTVERIPIPKISAEEQKPFIQAVDRILAEKATDPDAYTADFEREINRLVYDLYGLTEEEDTAIERSLDLIHATDEEEDAAILKAMLEGREEARAEGYATEEEVMAILRSSDGD